ncbi:MAG TPA: type I restriction endonuclease [Leptolyngbyaceae cyanobacterium]
MVQTIPAQDITINDLKTKFNLQQTNQRQFFREWQDNLPEVSESEKQLLERIKTNFLNLIEYPPMLENAVKMVVLSPLLDLAGFYQRPLRISTEKQVEIISEDEGTIIKGKIDVLVLQEQLWILVIEAKKAQFSLEPGIPQALAYMLDNPHPEKPIFGLVTNGSNFIFIKLIKQERSLYALSDEFTLRRANDLYIVLRILKQLGQLVSL